MNKKKLAGNNQLIPWPAVDTEPAVHASQVWSLALANVPGAHSVPQESIYDENS